MKLAMYDNWLLEAAGPDPRTSIVRAWVSNPQRVIVGYAAGALLTQADVIRRAMSNASTHYLKDLDAISGLEAAYFGTAGTLADCPACGEPWDSSKIPPPRVPLDIRCACCCQ